MQQQVSTGLKQSKFGYQMKIALSRRHLAKNRLKIEDFGYAQKKEGVSKMCEKDIYKTGRQSDFLFPYLVA